MYKRKSMQMLTKGHFTSVLVIDLDLLSFDLISIAFSLTTSAR